MPYAKSEERQDSGLKGEIGCSSRKTISRTYSTQFVKLFSYWMKT
jgi:hypothetical protein